MGYSKYKKSLETSRNENNRINDEIRKVTDSGEKFIKDKLRLDNIDDILRNSPLSDIDKQKAINALKETSVELKSDFDYRIIKEMTQLEQKKQGILNDVKKTRGELCKISKTVSKQKLIIDCSDLGSVTQHLHEKSSEAEQLEKQLEREQEIDIQSCKSLHKKMYNDDLNHNWERTMSTPYEESVLKDMEVMGEIDVVEENSDLINPKRNPIHLPTSKTGTFVGERGNSEFKPSSQNAMNTMRLFGRDTVEYKNGYPDFLPFTKHNSKWGIINGQVKIPHMTDKRENPYWEYGRRPIGESHNPFLDIGNFAQADNAVAEQFKKQGVTGKDIEIYRKDNHLVWHECADGETMQLVPESIHAICKHSGGVSEMKYRMQWGDIRRI